MGTGGIYVLLTYLLFSFPAGRRGDVTLLAILRFATGLEQEPLLGFACGPRLLFDAYLPGNLPQSNTCVNVLKLPIGHDMSDTDLFHKYDLAFLNTYFGYD
jgi:hypothetical protein